MDLQSFDAHREAGRLVHRDCPLCSDPNSAVPAGRYSRDGWPVIQCPRCGFVYLTTAPSYDALFVDLAWERTSKAEDRWRARNRPLSFQISKRTRWRMRILPRKSMPALLVRHGRPGNLVDLGCGDGGQMSDLPAGFTPFGIEISTELANAADARFRARGGHAINAVSIAGLRGYSDRFFSTATLRSYLEHELHPGPVLRELHRTLSVDGVALIKVPNYGSVNRMVRGVHWSGFRYPDHLNYFTPSTLARLAADCGFRAWFGATWRLPTSDNMWAKLIKA